MKEEANVAQQPRKVLGFLDVVVGVVCLASLPNVLLVQVGLA